MSQAGGGNNSRNIVSIRNYDVNKKEKILLAAKAEATKYHPKRIWDQADYFNSDAHTCEAIAVGGDIAANGIYWQRVLTTYDMYEKYADYEESGGDEEETEPVHWVLFKNIHTGKYIDRISAGQMSCDSLTDGSLAFSSCGTVFACAGYSHLWVIDIAPSSTSLSWRPRFSLKCQTVKFNPCKKNQVVMTYNGSAFLFDLSTNTVTFNFSVQGSVASYMDFSHNGELVCGRLKDQQVVVLRANSSNNNNNDDDDDDNISAEERLIKQWSPEGGDSILKAEFLPKSSEHVVTLSSTSCKVWNIATATGVEPFVLYNFDSPRGFDNRSFSFTNDARVLCIGCRNNNYTKVARFLSFPSGSLIRETVGLYPSLVTFSKQYPKLMTGDTNGNIFVARHSFFWVPRLPVLLIKYKSAKKTRECLSIWNVMVNVAMFL